jgi:hypothetical protein
MINMTISRITETSSTDAFDRGYAVFIDTPFHTDVNHFFLNALIAAASCGNDPLIDHILRRHHKIALINRTDHWGYTPLHIAVTKSHATAVETLIPFEADVNISKADGETPLCSAAKIYFQQFYYPRFIDVSGHHEIDLKQEASNYNIIRILHENHAVISPPLTVREQQAYNDLIRIFQNEQAQNRLMILDTLQHSDPITPNDVLQIIADFAASIPPKKHQIESDCTIS